MCEFTVTHTHSTTTTHASHCVHFFPITLLGKRSPPPKYQQQQQQQQHDENLEIGKSNEAMNCCVCVWMQMRQRRIEQKKENDVPSYKYFFSCVRTIKCNLLNERKPAKCNANWWMNNKLKLFWNSNWLFHRWKCTRWICFGEFCVKFCILNKTFYCKLVCLTRFCQFIFSYCESWIAFGRRAQS